MEETMKKYLCSALVIAGLGACNHGGKPSKTWAGNRNQVDVYGSRQNQIDDGESIAEAPLPQHRTRDEIATSGALPDATRRPQPAAEPARGAMRPSAPTTPQVADDTGVNERDRNGQTWTPMDQSEHENDMRITQRIRRAIVDNSALSFSSKNVKIITREGKVILRGTVPSKQERTLVVEAAQAQAGARNVDDQLELSGQ
jgi:hypothetical protein